MPESSFDRSAPPGEGPRHDPPSFTTFERELGAVADRILGWTVSPSAGPVGGSAAGPSGDPEKAGPPPQHPAASGKDDVAAARPAFRILVVDDDTEAACSLADLLRTFGMQVEVAHGGEDALAAARQVLPHAILCDLQMPSLDGFDVAHCLRADPLIRDAARVAITGSCDARTQRRALDAGFHAHLAKPIDVDTLLATLDRLLVDARD